MLFVIIIIFFFLYFCVRFEVRFGVCVCVCCLLHTVDVMCNYGSGYARISHTLTNAI